MRLSPLSPSTLMHVAAGALTSMVAFVAGTSATQAQSLVAQPIVQSNWAGFGANFQPAWMGVTKRIDWPVGGGGGGGEGSGGIIITSPGPPRTPPPIEILSANREFDANGYAFMQGVVASSSYGDSTSFTGPRDIRQARYGQILNLQDVLLSRGAGVTEQRSELTNNSFNAFGRVSAAAAMESSAQAVGVASAWGCSRVSVTYRVSSPVWFELDGSLSGAGSLSASFSLTSSATSEPLYSLVPAVGASPQSWKFNLTGVLPAGDYNMNIFTSATASIDSTASNAGGLGEFALSFVASPKRLGDVNGDAAVNAADLNDWKSSYGFQRDIDMNADGAVDGRDFLYWQQMQPLWQNTPEYAATMFDRLKVALGRPSGGDANGDRNSDGSDFLMWQRKQGPSVSNAAVPEPAAFSLVIAAALSIAARRLSARNRT